MLNSNINKKGQAESWIYMIIIIFVLGVIIFFFQHVSHELYSGFDSYLNSSPTYNESQALTSLNEIQDSNDSVWDYAFLAIFIGFIIQMVILSFATRLSIAFYWIYGIIGMVGLGIGVIVSNIWQDMVINPEFAETITRFPITNAILGTYYPMMITGILLVVIIVMFGKPNQEVI